MKISLKTAHRYSAYLLATFVLFHLLNHLSALFGPDTHIAVMKVLRIVYRNPFIEVLLLLSVLIQIVSGVLLVIRQRFWRSALTTFQAVSGLYLALFMINHVRATLLARFSWMIETDFFFAANVAVNPDTRAFFLPYYTFAIISVFTHVACAHYSRKLTVVGLAYESRIRREAIAIGVSGLVVTALIMACFGGLLYRF